MVYDFGDSVLDTLRRELRHAGLPVKLEGKVYQVLLYMVEHRDRLVSKKELLDNVWARRCVVENAVARCIGAARQAIGDSRKLQRTIRTVHGQGYRFVAPVTAHEGGARAAVAWPQVFAAMVPTGSGPRAPGREPAPRTARPKPVTILAGSLSLGLTWLFALDPQRHLSFRHALERLLHQTLHCHGGTLLYLEDNRFSGVFGGNGGQSHAERALLAAQALQRGWPAFVADNSTRDTSMTLGLGLHTGPVVEHQQDGESRPCSVVGEASLLAAYLAEQAQPGGVLLTAATSGLAPGVVPVELQLPLGEDGRSSRIQIFRVRSW